MNPADSALLVIDVQEKLVPHIADGEKMVWNIDRLIDATSLLEIPLVATEQYPKGLGHTIEPLAGKIESCAEKAVFSCRECEFVFDELASRGVRKILVAGIETHVCVMQTVLDLMSQGFELYLAVDAVGSRFDLDHQMALRRMESSGATLTTTESAIFEWCETSRNPAFKSISQIIQRTFS